MIYFSEGIYIQRYLPENHKIIFLFEKEKETEGDDDRVRVLKKIVLNI